MIDREDLRIKNIESDLNWLKNELKDLTKEEKRIILSSYVERVSDFGIGMREYEAFVKFFNDME